MIEFANLRHMFFEGSEKKLEIVVKGAGFRARPESFWRELVEHAQAKILSSIQNDQCTAYLLSESSLFVWDERVIMITCGTTTLVNAVLFLLDHVREEDVELLVYERKAELFPHMQQTDFFSDIRVLRERIPGCAYRFGSPDEHHMLLFHMKKPYQPAGVDSTLEILMYDLRGPAKEAFNSNQTLERVREITKIDQVFPDFKIDDFLFQPCGYSLNAIRGSDYYTVHVTPEETGSYVSFETNVRLKDQFSDTLASVLRVFQPNSFDLVYFHPEHELQTVDMSPFIPRHYVRQTLRCGYEVGFSTYFMRALEPIAALPLWEDV